MNFKGLKWLNFILTVFALFAIYIFLNDRLDPMFNTLLIVALVIIGLASSVPVLRDFVKTDNDT